MPTLLTIVSKSSVEEIQDEEGLGAFCMKPESQVSAESSFSAEGGPPFNANCCFRRNPDYCLGTDHPVGNSEEKLIRCLCRISLSPKPPANFLRYLYRYYPDSSKSGALPLGFGKRDENEAPLDLSSSMKMFKCKCQQCTEGGGNCGRLQ